MVGLVERRDDQRTDGLRLDVEAIRALSDDEISEHIADIQHRVAEIQAQLGNRNRTDQDGVRVSGLDYWDWRHRAVFALTRLTEELRELKLERAYRNRQTNGKPRPMALYAVLRKALGQIASGHYCADASCRCAQMAEQAMRDAWDIDHAEPTEGDGE